MSSSTSTSAILLELAARPHERLTIGELLDALRQQAFAALILVLGLPNCLPMPPPIPLLFGFLLLFVAIQMVVGRSSPWLPKRVLSRSMARADFARAVGRALPTMRKLEHWSRPRLTFFGTPIGIRLVGAVVLVISLALLVAAPIIGQIPLGLAACLVGLGLVERDGLLVIGGTAVGAIGLSLSLGFVVAIVSGVTALI
ncbi:MULTISPECIES: exopolysaccharide biosynthesis protein [unclassified Chelatococcus]|uniref:exopolysaccharide biosynthesis protein n=1 Tax=unclassified Chelatococcus TaxID=2638111 RepID=UPI001BCC21E1|nr:exopolysaccharide biosynthesis protein [Chelatococcus sp.]MBS7698091.1 exopolysaccharide biosynthesis protein [Chelatococcus sp. YT9]MBX3556591.1 exopolysaccharide biosynthesis protein [Chelatococcus sp.]